MKGLRRRHGRSRRRYGCFQLPKVPGASRVTKARRRSVPWLARTDIDSREVEFSEHWDRLTPAEKAYIVDHERAHLAASERHDDAFYRELKRIREKAGKPPSMEWELEVANLPKGKGRCSR